mmetsp:Transcript_35264/g.76815  ORF Transcript_35264/g.76815 Transcript_35264/m.76815 type:complete len:232 (-) Transcript_35264:117-812(-)
MSEVSRSSSSDLLRCASKASSLSNFFSMDWERSLCFFSKSSLSSCCLLSLASRISRNFVWCSSRSFACCSVSSRSKRAFSLSTSVLTCSSDWASPTGAPVEVAATGAGVEPSVFCFGLQSRTSFFLLGFPNKESPGFGSSIFGTSRLTLSDWSKSVDSDSDLSLFGLNAPVLNLSLFTGPLFFALASLRSFHSFILKPPPESFFAFSSLYNCLKWSSQGWSQTLSPVSKLK